MTKKAKEKNLLKKYEPSILEKMIIFFNTYEFGDNLVNGINSAKYIYLDSFAENLMIDQKSKKDDDFLYTLELDPVLATQLRKYLLKQKKFYIKQVMAKESFDYTYLYQLFLQIIPYELNDIEKHLLLDGYINVVTDLMGHTVSHERRRLLEKKLNINK